MSTGAGAISAESRSGPATPPFPARQSAGRPRDRPPRDSDHHDDLTVTQHSCDVQHRSRTPARPPHRRRGRRTWAGGALYPSPLPQHPGCARSEGLRLVRRTHRAAIGHGTPGSRSPLLSAAIAWATSSRGTVGEPRRFSPRSGPAVVPGSPARRAWDEGEVSPRRPSPPAPRPRDGELVSVPTKRGAGTSRLLFGTAEETAPLLEANTVRSGAAGTPSGHPVGLPALTGRVASERCRGGRAPVPLPLYQPRGSRESDVASSDAPFGEVNT